jgi:hypothetical protein
MHVAGGPLSPPAPVDEDDADVGPEPPPPGGQSKSSLQSSGSSPQPDPSQSHPVSVELATTIPQSALRIRSSFFFERARARVFDRLTYPIAGADG